MMKKTLLTVCSSLLAGICAVFAQTDSVVAPYSDQVQHIFEHVNLGEVPNGVLYDYGFPLHALEKYDGLLRADNKSTYTNFGLAYAALYSMAITDPQRLPEPDAYRSVMDQQGQVLRIAGLHQVYYQLDENAVSEGLLLKVNEQLYDVPNRSKSPYLRRECFMLAPSTDLIRADQLTLRFESALFFNNSGKTPAFLELDWGHGAQNLPMDQEVVLKNLTAGTHLFQLRMHYVDGTVYASHFELHVEDLSLNKDYGVIPDIHKSFETADSYNLVTGKADVYVSLACGHSSLQKPFIWCEGYNPNMVFGVSQNLTYLDAIDRFDFTLQPTNQVLSDYLEQQGYDLVVIDYHDGGDYIQRNALVVRDIIRWVNEEKHKNGSKEKNVVMGQSMGGMVARVALRNMELNGEDHETETYISFDTGHLGVNVPLGVQYSVRHLAGMHILGKNKISKKLAEFVQVVENAEKMLELPASRQMLIHYADEKFELGFWDKDENRPSLHEAYYEYQNKTLGMPQNCEVLAISNGSLKGLNGKHNFSDGSKVLGIYQNNFTILFNLLGNPGEAALGTMQTFMLGTNVKVDLDIYAVPHFDLDKETIYEAHITARILGIPIVYSHALKRVEFISGLDAGAGGFVYESPMSLKTDKFDFTPYVATFKLQTFCFVPVPSALNYYQDAWNYTEVKSPYRNFEDYTTLLSGTDLRGVGQYSGALQSRTYDGVTGVYQNTGHTYFNSENAPFMLYHLVGDDGLSALSQLGSGQKYNFGKRELHYSSVPGTGARRTSATIDHNLDIQSGAELAVNHYDGIGFDINSTQGMPIPAISHFAVDIRYNCFAPQSITLTVRDQALFHIGNGLGRTAEVHAHNQSKIVVEAGGILFIHANSLLKLHAGATLHLKAGAQVILRGGGSIDVDKNATIIYEEGATIVTEASNSHIRLAGTLHLGTQALFELDHSFDASSGYVQFSGQPIIESEEGAILRFSGKAKNDPIVYLEPGCKLNVTAGDLVRTVVENGTVYFGAGSTWSTTEELRISDAAFQADAVNGGLVLTDKNLLDHSDFINVPLDARLHLENKAPLIANNCRFEFSPNLWANTDATVKVEGMSYTFDFCTFRTPTQVALLSKNLQHPSSVSYSDFQRTFASTYFRNTGISDRSNTEIRVTGSTFSRLERGISKTSGKLSLRCNSISGTNGTALYLSDCELNMSTDELSGYNNLDNPFGANIEAVAVKFKLNKGYNYIDGATSPKNISGTSLQLCGATGSCKLELTNNQWNQVNQAPSAQEFSLFSTNGYPVKVMAQPLAQKTTCGAYDGPDTPVDPGGGKGGGPVIELAGIIPDPGTGSTLVPVEIALKMAALHLTLNNENGGGDNLKAIEILNRVFLSKTEKNREIMQPYLDDARLMMKTAVEGAFRDGSLQTVNNQQQFETPVAYYVSALNALSQPGEQKLNGSYYQQFYIELDKAKLFSLIEQPETALQILLELEKCGLAEAEQEQVNYWRGQYQRQIRLLQLPLTEAMQDSSEADSSGFGKPKALNGSTYFGSLIQGPSLLEFSSCNTFKSIQLALSETHLLYPNPNTGQFNVRWQESVDGERLPLQILSLTGQVLHQQEVANGDPIEISLPSGIYLYRLGRTGEFPYQGRLVIKH